MPTIPENATTREVTLFDAKFSLPNAFAEGHVLTTLEADFINSRVATAVTSALASSVRRAVAKIDDERAKAFKAKTYDGPLDEKGKPAKATIDDGFDALNLVDDASVQSELESIFEEYEVGGNNRGGDGPKLSALDKAIRALAVKGVIAWAKKAGRKVKDLREAMREDGTTSVFDFLVEGYAEKHRERLEPVAQAQLDATKAADEDADEMEAALDE